MLFAVGYVSVYNRSSSGIRSVQGLGRSLSTGIRSGKSYRYLLLRTMVAPLMPGSRGTFRRGALSRHVSGQSGAVDCQRAGERVTPRSIGFEQRFRKAGRGVGEQIGVAWCRGNALRQLEEGKGGQETDKVLPDPKILTFYPFS